MYRELVLHVFGSPTASQRLAAALAQLRQVPQGHTTLIIAPNRRAGRALLRAWVRERGAVLDCEVCTLPQLALQLARPQLSEEQLSPVSPRAAEALCTGLLATLPAVDLGPLGTIATQPSLPRALVRTLNDLKTHGVDRAALQKRAPHLQTLLQAYEQALRADNLVDPHDVVQIAIARATGQALRFQTLIGLDLQLRTAAEAKFVFTLTQQVSCAWLCWPTGDVTTTELCAAAGLPRPAPPSSPPTDATLERLQHHLFGEAPAPAPAGPSLRILSLPDESRECTEIARTLLWTAEADVPFDRMAILPRNLAPYRTYLSEALDRAGIPAYFARAARRPDPNGRALLALLHCRAEGLSARRFAEYLSLQVAPESPHAPQAENFVPPEESLGRVLERTPPPSSQVQGLRWPQRFERLLSQAAIIAGQAQFEQRLAGLAEDLAQQLASSAEAGVQDPTIATALHDLQALRSFAPAILAALSTLPDQAPLDHWLSQLTALARQTLLEPGTVLGTLLELQPLGRAGRPLNLTQLLRLLTPLLSELTVWDASDETGKVFIADAAAARGRSFALVCTPGLVEKVFPARVKEDPLLLDALRQHLNPALPTHPQRVQEERTYLHIAAGAAEQQLLLTYPRMDLQGGRPRVPSFYALEALRAAEGQLPSYEALMRRAEAELPSRAGWPAPHLPLDAIDDAEHDLASLATPLAKPENAADTLGQARYLLLTNPHLARALRARARRWGVKTLGPDDGLVDPPLAIRAALNAHRPSQRPYTGGALALYAACPYRFYLKAVLELGGRPQPTPAQTMPPLQRAELLRASQRDTLRALQQAKLLPLRPSGLEQALSLATRALKQHANRYRERFAPAVQRVFDDGVQRALADLHTWLRREAVAPTASAPLHIDLRIGLPADEAQDPSSTQEPIPIAGGLGVQGHIDLVQAQGGEVHAILFRSGQAGAPAGLYTAGGQHLSPLLEAAALRALYPQAQRLVGQLYYNTARGGFEQRTIPLDAQAEATLQRAIRTIDDALVQGCLPAVPTSQACEHCEYQAVCGPHERLRTRHKRGPQLQPLTELRRQR